VGGVGRLGTTEEQASANIMTSSSPALYTQKLRRAGSTDGHGYFNEFIGTDQNAVQNLKIK